MRKARVFVNGIEAGILVKDKDAYVVRYNDDYEGSPISLTMPIGKKIYEFDQFPPFFEGLLPEGGMLEALLRKYKLDRYDYFGQLMQIGNDLVGDVSVEEIR